jgi:type II secretory pathway pseudopilin PulG
VSRNRPAARAGRQHAGFTYLALMILVAILALATSATVTLGSIAQRRQAELRLLEVGDLYRQAITSYLNSSPGGNRRYPGSLNDLLKDPRYPGVRRHLRQLYPDPITGKKEWGVVPAPGGGIMAVHSLSEAKPIKIAGFEAENQLFEGKLRYSEWAFGALAMPAAAGVAPGAGGGGVPGANPAGLSPQGAGSVPAQTPALFPGQVPAQVPGSLPPQTPTPSPGQSRAPTASPTMPTR